MYLSVVNVAPLENYHLLLKFENNEEKIFDVNPYLDLGKFQELKDEKLFQTVRICFDSIEWDNHLDLDPELLYQKSTEQKAPPSASKLTSVKIEHHFQDHKPR